MTHGRLLAATATLGLAATTLLLTAPATAAPKTKGPDSATLSAKLHQLNRSGAQGTATATVSGSTLTDVSVTARGLTPDAPHAVHVHYGETAEHECPTMGDGTQRRTDGTRRVNVADGVPYYGPIAVSLTTTGDTSPGSGLALERMPVSTDGVLSYARSGISTSQEIADAIARGEGVVVVHGVDYDKDGRYGFESAGASELTAAAPAEATDPALCGVLRDEPGHDH